MPEKRQGFLTKEQEQKIDDLIKSGILEPIDGVVIRLADDKGLEALKVKLEEKYPEAVPIVYEVVDAIFEMLPQS